MYFKVYPPLFSITKMNLTQYIQLSCNSNYSLSSATYDTSGVLALAVDYSSDL